MPVPPPRPDRPADVPDPGPRLPRSPRARLLLLTVTLAAAAVVAVVYEPHRLLAADRWPDGLTDAAASPLFALAYGLAAAAFVPRPLLGVAAGALYGAVLGTAVALAGTVLGAALCLGLGRTLGQEALRPLLRGRLLRAGDRQLSEHGLRAVVLLRLLPGIPFAASNYAASVSRVRWPVFLGGSLLGSVPHTFAYAFAGSRATEPASPLFLSALGLIALTGLAGLLLVRRRRTRPPTDPADPAADPADPGAPAEAAGPHLPVAVAVRG